MRRRISSSPGSVFTKKNIPTLIVVAIFSILFAITTMASTEQGTSDKLTRNPMASETGLGPTPFFNHQAPGANFVKVGVSTRKFPLVQPQSEPFVLTVPALPTGAVVVETFISWNYLLNGIAPSTDGIAVNGNTVTGALVGTGTPDLCWSKGGVASYMAAGIPSSVINPGQAPVAVTIAGATDKPLGTDPNAYGEGLTILVVFGISNNLLRNVDLYRGYISTQSGSVYGEAAATLNYTVPYKGWDFHFFVNGLDGQVSPDSFFIDGVNRGGQVSGTQTGSDAWQGALGSAPGYNFPYDHANGDISAFLTSPDPSLNIITKQVSDCVGHSFAAVSFPVLTDSGQAIVSEKDSIHCNVETANDLHITYYSDTWMTLSNHYDGPFTNFQVVQSTIGNCPFWPCTTFYECTWSGATVHYCDTVAVGAEFRQTGWNKLLKKDIYWTLDGVKVGNHLPIPGFDVFPPYGRGPIIMSLHNDAAVPLTITNLEIGIVPSVVSLTEMEYSLGALGPIRPGPIGIEPGHSWDTVLNPGSSAFSLLVQGYSSGPTGEAYFVNQHEHLATPAIRIQKTHNTLQGHYVTVPITIESSDLEMGGFDFLIAYDAAALTLAEVTPGDLLDTCDWEYFTYRFGANGNCGSACPSGLLRIVALAETNNGDNHPACWGPPDTDPHELAVMKFLVSNDRTFECQYVPIRFFWGDCGDNSISRADGELLYIDRAIYDFEDNIIWDEEDDVQFPEDARIPFAGTPDYCLNPDPEKPSAQRYVDFINGGVDIVCADSIDTRGDVNLNGLSNEIGDAVVFTNYFITGLAAFTVNVEGQIAATEINADGIPLSVADLVYLIRIITGDAPPYPKSRSLKPIEAVLDRTPDGALSISCTTLIGAAYLVVEGEVTPVLKAEGMKMTFRFDGTNTRILIYPPFDNNVKNVRGFSGKFLEVKGNLISTELATVEGIPVKLNLTPVKFALAQNFPNPFNLATQVEFSLPAATEVKLEIYNVTGQLVRTLVDKQLPAGYHKVIWDGRNDAGTITATGVYLYKLQAAAFTETKKMLLLK